MAEGRGFDAIMGVGKESTWGTAVAATQKVPFISETLSKIFTPIQNPSLVGVASPRQSDQGVLVADGGFTAMMTYKTRDFAFEQFFGTYTPSTTAAPHAYTLNDTVDNKALTVAHEKTVSVHEFAGFKPSQLTVTGTPGDGVQYTMDGMAKNQSLTSTLNTSAVLSTLAEPATNIKFHEGVFSLQTVGSTVALVAYAHSAFSLTVNRQHEASEVNSQNRLEPKENNFRESLLSVTLPRHTTDQFQTWHDSHQKLFGKLKFTDTSTQAHVKEFRLNKLIVEQAPANVDGPGFIAVEVQFRLFNDLENDNTSTEFTFSEEIKLFEST